MRQLLADTGGDAGHHLRCDVASHVNERRYVDTGDGRRAFAGRRREEKALDDTWKAIRITWDDYVEDVDELGGVAASNQDKNHIREKIIPDTIGRYRALSANVSAVIATDADLVAEKTVLVAICGYKVRQLEGMESYYHAAQIETYDAKKGKDEYRNAKYTLQDALDAINALNVYTLANPSRYSTYVYDDKGDIEDAIDEITSHIARL